MICSAPLEVRLVLAAVFDAWRYYDSMCATRAKAYFGWCVRHVRQNSFKGIH